MKNNDIQKNQAFTLIELLAVIIILGVLMIIAVPSVTKYINDSRRNGYISTAKEIAGGARNLIHSGSLNINDKDTTYYIDSECIETSNASESPYGEFTKAYVVVNYNDDGYDYYWLSVDSTGNGVKTITNINNLDSDSIESNLTNVDIPDSLGVDARHKYVIINKESGCTVGNSIIATSRVTDEGSADIVDYPAGKNKKTLNVGDIVKIGNEEFFFVKSEGNDILLFARYNLKVGSVKKVSDYSLVKTYGPSDPGYGLQSSECIGGDEDYPEYKCVLKFSNGKYWDGQIGEGKKYPDSFIYDENSNLYQYVESYKSYLEGLGVHIKNARVPSYNDLSLVKDPLISTVLCNTSHWTGEAEDCSSSVGCLGVNLTHYRSGIFSSTYTNFLGVRPIIVI